MANQAVGLDNGLEETVEKKPLFPLARPQRGPFFNGILFATIE